MGKVYVVKNVYDATIERLEKIFSENFAVYFSFSGGKDSSVMLQLANLVAKKKNKKFDVLFIDLEGNYKYTIEHVKELRNLSQIDEFYWVCLPLVLRNSVSQLSTHWLCWDKRQKEFWIRDMPKDCINEENYLSKYGWDFFISGMQFETFIVSFAKWYQKNHDKPVMCGVAIRTNESFNRFRAIVSLRKEKWKDCNWTTRVQTPWNLPIYNFYPIYDWETRDIWIAVSKFDLKYNKLYELLYKSGLSIHEARICQPYGDDQRKGLNQFKAIEPETWSKLLIRVGGVNFGNIYAKSLALGYMKLEKPSHLTWQEYTIFLLESIGIKNYDLMIHYARKIERFIEWYEVKKAMPMRDFGPKHLESQKKIASWRRCAKMILKNDYYGRELSFSQTKRDDAELKAMLEKDEIENKIIYFNERLDKSDAKS
ncbi:DUF3440 domain-containing protein [Fusobacterium necrophorum]|uniref:DUF3440 domain-containing protein n=1 Tax=Fusobacterium necrophorum TaxID=859 RepID=UPI00254DC82D|nr:DUF3440 domain-containing protein [Fusobacterium necrophorum]MDK4500901.1 DUF3440 domain-containing protein [Fusobacterium necrophorum]